jgi:hypothetical protein
MKQYQIYRDSLEAAKILAEKNELVLTVSNETGNVAWITVVAKQPENLPSILAVAEKDGMANSFTTKFGWTKESLETVDYTLCQKCGVKHNRVKIFVLELGETKEQIQVGGTCAKNLNCETRVKKLLNLFKNFEEQINEEDYEYGGDSGQLRNTDIARITLGVVRKYGYVSGKKSFETFQQPTIEIVRNLMCGPDENIKEIQSSLDKSETNDEILTRTEQFVEEKSKAEWSNFWHNCQIALGRFRTKDTTLIVTAIALAEVDRHYKIKSFVRIEVEPKTKIDFTGTVLKAVTNEGQWGNTRAVTILDEKYGKIWFNTTIKEAWDLNVGDKISGKITVKGKETGIYFGTRPKISEVIVQNQQLEASV